ncbi:MAG: Xaa-Pro peptidase family protein [Planctomycetota bacterium]
MTSERPILLAGVPGHSLALYHRIRFSASDPASYIDIPGEGSTLIIRDIEVGRASRHAKADRVFKYEDFDVKGGLSGDRETRVAEATAECLRRAGLEEVWADRTLPLIFAHHCEAVGVRVRYDPDLAVRERRSKDEQEVEHLRHAQAVTEKAMELACKTIARASASADGTLIHDGEPLTSERVRTLVDALLLEHNFENPHGTIVASGRTSSDCHDRGSGEIRTGEPVIIDIFPRDKDTMYHGDCTRCVVHGDVPEAYARMHETVQRSKRAAIEATRAGMTGEGVHNAAIVVIKEAGYRTGVPEAGDEAISMVHGTGHGIGLDVHEPPLLDVGGPELVEGDAITIEPGLYGTAIGGVRLEDMVIVRAGGCDNLNTLHDGLDWT